MTLAYITGRREPHWEWFFQGLRAQLQPGDAENLRMAVVDFYAHRHLDLGWSAVDVLLREADVRTLCPIEDLVYTHPIWGPWQGPHRLTRDHWTAKAEYLNTAACFTPGKYLACVDDLSVLGPQWLQAVREGCRPEAMTCGAYRKVNDLAVENGVAVSWTDSPGGRDIRWPTGSNEGPVKSFGNSAYGCSFVVDIEQILKVNGWPAVSNGIGYEDCIQGVALERRGTDIFYDRRMFTYESEELHFAGHRLRSSDYGTDPNDKSHALKAMAYDMPVPRWENHYNLAQLRKRVLAGEPLPVITEPTTEWFTGKPLDEL